MADGFPFPLSRLLGMNRDAVNMRRYDPELDNAATEPFPSTATDIELPKERGDIELPLFGAPPAALNFPAVALSPPPSRQAERPMSIVMPERPSSREAISILRSRFGGFDPTYVPVDDESGYGDSTGSLALHAARSRRADALANRLPFEEAAALVPQEGYVQGEPGRRTRTNPNALSAFLTRRN